MSNKKGVRKLLKKKEETFEPITLKDNNKIFKFFLKMLAIFILIDFGILILLNIFPTFLQYYKYGSDLIIEIFYAIFVLIVMLLFKNAYVFTEKKEKFFKSFKYAIPIIAYSVVVLIGNVLSLDTFSLGSFINLVIYCIFIGITEEFLCRGWLQNEFIERFGNTKRGVITSIILSSLIFGLMHLTNVFATSQGMFQTILQVLNATSLGFLLGIIYYKTKNIWSVITLHAFYDFCLLIGEMNLIKECSFGELTPGITFINCLAIVLLSVFWILTSILVVRKCNFPDSKSKKRNNSKIIFGIVLTFCLFFVPFESLVPGYDEYYVCYSYNETETLENYVTHYPHFDTYTIDYTTEESMITLESADSIDIQESIVVENFNFEFKLNDLGEVTVENINTGHKIKLNEGYWCDDLVVIENDNDFIVLMKSDMAETKIYYSHFLEKDSLLNTDKYLEDLKNSFKVFELPYIQQMGYVTLENDNTKYPFFYSSIYDLFIVRDGELFLIK